MPHSLTPDAIVYDLETAADPQLSPDGTWILFKRSKAERGAPRPESQLWLCDRGGGNLRQITQAGTRNSGGRWSPDGRAIAFASDRVATSGLFLLSLDGGDARELTRHMGQIGDLAWSPDGATIAYTVPFDPENPDEREPEADEPPRVRVTARIDYKQDNRGYLGDKRSQVWLVDVAGGERRMLTGRPVDHAFPQWSPDGRTIAAKLPNRNGLFSRLGLIDVATSETTAVGPEDGVVGCWAWSPGGDRILIAGDTSPTWQLDLFLLHVASGELRRLTDDLACLPDAGFPTVAPPSQPVWLDDRTALFHAVRGGASGLYTVDTETGTVEQVHQWPSLAGAPSADGARRSVVQAHASLDTPSALVLFDLAERSGREISDLNQEVAPTAIWHRFDTERAGHVVEAWLLMPHDPDPSPEKRYPLILDIHGGPNSYYGYGFNAIQQALAGAGFAVLFCNPRGSGSYGRAFTQAVVGDWAGEDYLDLMAVLDAAIADPRFAVDPERLGVYGYSYGGYMSSWIIGHTHRFDAAVIGAPVVDLVSFYGTSDIGHVFGPLQIGGAPWECEAEYRARSPLTAIHGATTPTLIVHGEADDRCPIGQGEQLFATLLANGCEVEFARYPGGAHTMLRVGPSVHRLDVLERMVGWFSGHLRA